MSIPKWREPIINPFALDLSPLKLIEIRGYPHAGNDVFECLNQEGDAFYLKIARQQDSYFQNEVQILHNLQSSSIPIPKLLVYQIETPPFYLATKGIKGARLSEIKIDSPYLYKFGESLGKIHQLHLNADPAPNRRFHKYLKPNVIEEYQLTPYQQWLEKHVPTSKEQTFIHGDHHYANLLWDNHQLVGVLDWEFSGIGWKEFDLAWAIILRPSQQFLKTAEEQQSFLNGYTHHSHYDTETFNWCKVLIYLHFYIIGCTSNDAPYCKYIIEQLNELCH